MSWGAGPVSFKISQRALSYDQCEAIYNDKDYQHKKYEGANIHGGRSPGRSNYWIRRGDRRNPVTKRVSTAYYLLMYSTEIIRWWKDGTTELNYYDSASTRHALEAFSPIKRIWRDTRNGFRESVRFGDWQKDHYPFGTRGEGVVIHPDGYVHGLVDKRMRVIPSERPRRREMLEQFRRNALPRMLLDEFGDTFALNRQQTVKLGFGRFPTGNWWGVSLGRAAGPFFEAMINNADHETIVEILQDAPKHDASVPKWRVTGVYLPAKDRNDAIVKTMKGVARTALDGSAWYEWYDIPLAPVLVGGP